MTPARERHHLVGDVDTGGNRTSLGRPLGRVPRTRPHVEHAYARGDSGRVEQRLHEPGGDPAGEQAVALGLLTPTGSLERLEGLGAGRTLVQDADQKSSTSSTSSLGSPLLVDAIRSAASSGPSFQTERMVWGATLTAVSGPSSTRSSSSFNSSRPERTR